MVVKFFLFLLWKWFNRLKIFVNEFVFFVVNLLGIMIIVLLKLLFVINGYGYCLKSKFVFLFVFKLIFDFGVIYVYGILEFVIKL